MRSFLRSLQDKKKINFPAWILFNSKSQRQKCKEISDVFQDSVYKVVFDSRTILFGKSINNLMSTVRSRVSRAPCSLHASPPQKTRKSNVCSAGEAGECYCLLATEPREVWGQFKDLKYPAQPRARPREQQSNARSPFMWSARRTPRFEQVEW